LTKGSHCPACPEIVDAADWLRYELGVTKCLWREACVAMGREQAAIASPPSSQPSQRRISVRPQVDISTAW
jgi:hypothetical protein